MIIEYIRSSSYQCHDFCEMNYFIEYVLGWKSDANIKTEKGTIVHKILEILAKIKLAQQKSENTIVDDIIGKVDCKSFNIDDIVDKVFGYYAAKQTQCWSEKDLVDCHKWVNKTLNFNNGAFNPLNLNIVAPEQHFDITINEPWAHYEYNINGKNFSGQLSLKGTIDLITSPCPGVYEIIDWKTGRRLNWATGEEKTHEKLCQDPQLMMYFLAASHLYPDIEQIMTTVYFINSGGPYSLCFTKDDIPKTLNMIKQKFEHIKTVIVPKLTKSWKCSKFCQNGKNTFTNTTIKPIIEFRNGQVCSKGQLLTRCEQIRFEVDRKGIDKVMMEYSEPNHKVGDYTNPGE